MRNVEQINKRLYISSLEQTTAYTLSCNIFVLIRTLSIIWSNLFILVFVTDFMNNVCLSYGFIK